MREVAKIFDFWRRERKCSRFLLVSDKDRTFLFSPPVTADAVTAPSSEGAKGLFWHAEIPFGICDTDSWLKSFIKNQYSMMKSPTGMKSASTADGWISFHLRQQISSEPARISSRCARFHWRNAMKRNIGWNYLYNLIFWIEKPLLIFTINAVRFAVFWSLPSTPQRRTGNEELVKN